MTLVPITDLEDRVHRLLCRTADAAEAREKLIEEVESASAKDPALHNAVKKISHIHQSEIPLLMTKVGQTARSIDSFAKETQEQSAHVRYLCELMERVTAAQRVAESLLQMDVSTKEVRAALEANDLDRMAHLITSYTAAKEKVLGNHSDTSLVIRSSVVVEEACARGVEVLKAKAAEAKANRDKSSLVWSTTLLSKLGETALATELYSDWVCDETISSLQKTVAEELLKMNTPHAAQSHLVLVSQQLDMVAGTFEAEELFVSASFGVSSAAVLLQRLHDEATKECVPVLEDFLQRRKDVATTLEDSLNVQQTPHKKRETGGTSSVVSSPSSPSSAVALTSVARRADQVLEEISHIASCCHIYFAFVEKQFSRLSGTAETADTSKKDGVDHLWESQSNPLLVCVQQILSMYCPIQLQYFRVAFSQAVSLQKDAIQEKVSTCGAKARNGSGTGIERGFGSLMRYLEDFYTESLSGLERENKVALEEAYYRSPDIVTLPDDIFYVLRIAVHRAFNTKSTQVISAVLAFASDVVRESFIPEVERRASSTESNVVLPSALRWLSAAQKSVSYTTKLSEELTRRSLATYAGSVLQRLDEQAADVQMCANQLSKKVTSWVAQCATVVLHITSPPHFERLKALDYVMSEETLYYYELNDPWAQAFLNDCGGWMEDLKRVLDADTFDKFLQVFTVATVKTLRQYLGNKKFNPCGALQIDKDVRAICYLLSSFAERISLRESYAALTLTTSLLLVDRPRDALDEAHNSALSSEEKRRVLLQRVDLNEEEVIQLKL